MIHTITRSLLLALVLSGLGCGTHVIEAGVWFEPVTFSAAEVQADRLGGAITEQEMVTIASAARAEIARAFAGLRINVSDRRDATYRVRVVQDLRNPRFPRGLPPAGESRAITGIGGQGAVSFRLLASNAIAHAPPDADRATMIAAIGRGVGVAAVHEFAHELLGTAQIHDTTDTQSYEYPNADRREQFYGEMHWDIAGPMLQKRIGTRVTTMVREAER